MKRIRLTGKYAIGKHTHTIVDNEDYEYLNKYKWKAKPNGFNNRVYAVRNVKRNGRNITLRMHRVIMNVGQEIKMDVDHINHNSLDNRKNNLRLVQRSVNIKNMEVVII